MDEDKDIDCLEASSFEMAKVEKKPVRLSLHMIVRRHLPEEAQQWDQEKILEALNDITHLRLDRENIKDIDSLELLGPRLTNIYLQHNVIEKLENFECLKNLNFLVLSGNRIKTVENLSHLPKLHFLDLSQNLIADFDIDEFPQSLLMLDLRDNPCVHVKDYRGRILQDLANLVNLDGEDISPQEKLEVGFAQDSSDENVEEEDADEPAWQARDKTSPKEEAEPEEEAKLDLSDRGRIRAVIFGREPVLPDVGASLKSLRNDMMQRSQLRQQESQLIHDRRRMELEEVQMSMSRPSSQLSMPPPSQPSPAPPSMLSPIPPSHLSPLSPPKPSSRPPSGK